jgi:transcriptional regulator GlxA family with amidase domain
VESGSIITSRGAGTAIPFSLKIIERLTDRENAARVAQSIVFCDRVDS